MTTIENYFEDSVRQRRTWTLLPVDRAMQAMRAHISARRRARSVAGLSDHLLRDIGIDPEDVRGHYPSDLGIANLHVRRGGH